MFRIYRPTKQYILYKVYLATILTSGLNYIVVHFPGRHKYITYSIYMGSHMVCVVYVLYTQMLDEGVLTFPAASRLPSLALPLIPILF